MYTFAIPLRKIDKDTPNKKLHDTEMYQLHSTNTKIQRTLSFLSYLPEKLTSRQTKIKKGIARQRSSLKRKKF